jgi:hypothetical protein
MTATTWAPIEALTGAVAGPSPHGAAASPEDVAHQLRALGVAHQDDPLVGTARDLVGEVALDRRVALRGARGVVGEGGGVVHGGRADGGGHAVLDQGDEAADDAGAGRLGRGAGGDHVGGRARRGRSRGGGGRAAGGADQGEGGDRGGEGQPDGPAGPARPAGRSGRARGAGPALARHEARSGSCLHRCTSVRSQRGRSWRRRGAWPASDKHSRTLPKVSRSRLPRMPRRWAVAITAPSVAMVMLSACVGRPDGSAHPTKASSPSATSPCGTDQRPAIALSSRTFPFQRRDHPLLRLHPDLRSAPQRREPRPAPEQGTLDARGAPRDDLDVRRADRQLPEIGQRARHPMSAQCPNALSTVTGRL